MSDVKRYALRLYNEWGGYSPEMVNPQTLPNPEDRAKYVEASDYDALAADNQRLREALREVMNDSALRSLMTGDQIKRRVAALAGSKEGDL